MAECRHRVASTLVRVQLESTKKPAWHGVHLESNSGGPKSGPLESVICDRLQLTPWTLNTVFTIHGCFPKRDVAGSIPVSRSMFPQDTDTRHNDLLQFAPIAVRRPVQGVDGPHPTFERGSGILVLVYVNAVAHLISSNLRIYAELFQETGMRPAHHLKIYPSKLDRGKTWYKTSSPKQAAFCAVTGAWGSLEFFHFTGSCAALKSAHSPVSASRSGEPVQRLSREFQAAS